MRIIKGNPTPEEVAAVVTVLSALAARPASAPDPSAGGDSGWASYWRRARTPLHPGPGAWKASARP